MTVLLLCLGLRTSLSAQNWDLSWSDEFNAAQGTGIDSTKWAFDRGILSINGVQNPHAELQYYCAPSDVGDPLVNNYCDPTQPNASLDGSHLVIQPRPAPVNTWTSARLKTQGLQTMQYGRLETRIQVPSHAGYAPFFLLRGADLMHLGQPAAGQMDVMKNWLAIGPQSVATSLRGEGYSGEIPVGAVTLEPSINSQYPLPGADRVDTSFHIYGIIWSPRMVQFYLDDPANIVLVRTINDIPSGTSWPFDNPFYVTLGLAVGGDFGGQPDAGTATAGPMLVDYIRYYQAQQIPGPAMTAPSISMSGNSIGSTTISFTSASGTGLVFLSCSGAPARSSCTIDSGNSLHRPAVDFSNSTSATATLRIAPSGTKFSELSPANRMNWGWAVLACFLAFALVPGGKKPPRRRLSILAGICIAGTLLLQGCGGSGSGGSSQIPPGQYNLTVTAYTVSGDTSTVNVPLTVN